MSPRSLEHGLGRRYAPDPRDRRYEMTARRVPLVTRDTRYWNAPPVTDQGNAPHCVGHAWYGYLMAAPIMQRTGRKVIPPADLYARAQLVDEWPGEDYDGTSVRAGAKVLHGQLIILEYNWALDSDVLRAYVLSRGPVVVGTDWFAGMSDPTFLDDPKQTDYEAWLEPTGRLQGGHAYLIYGYSAKRKAYRMQNSWGNGWGEGGRAWVERDVMDWLIFGANGEACSALEAG